MLEELVYGGHSTTRCVFNFDFKGFIQDVKRRARTREV
jgi:hypothetical protein